MVSRTRRRDGRKTAPALFRGRVGHELDRRRIAPVHAADNFFQYNTLLVDDKALRHPGEAVALADRLGRVEERREVRPRLLEVAGNRRLATVVVVMFLVLMGATTYVQYVQAPTLNADQRNVRTLYREFGNARGPIIVGDTAIATSVPIDDSFGYQRQYANGPLYAPITGFYSVVYQRSGVEEQMNTELNGSADSLFYTRLQDLVTELLRVLSSNLPPVLALNPVTFAWVLALAVAFLLNLSSRKLRTSRSLLIAPAVSAVLLIAFSNTAYNVGYAERYIMLLLPLVLALIGLAVEHFWQMLQSRAVPRVWRRGSGVA